ncbi:MAG TPA: hypothetical protein VES20_12115 [Bryobacteraceae bacterium]|nr:hypothetical protein [Bryobacteraceae bacterium]
MQKTLEVTRSLVLADVKDLASAEPPCITITIPVQPAPNPSRVDAMRLKSAVRQAEDTLERDWTECSPGLRKELSSSLHTFFNEADEIGGEGGSLVVLRSPDVFRAFQVKPLLDEAVVISNHFGVFPFLGALQVAEEKFYILALSQNNVRLLRCTPDSSEQVDLGPNTPVSLEEWLNTRLPNSAPDHGTVRDAPEGSTGGSFTSTHDRDNKDEHIYNFFRVIDRAVFDLLRGQKYPVVLCGVEYERTMYKGLSQYEHVMSEGVQGSPESLKGGEMHGRALEVVQEFFAQPAKKALALWERMGGTDRVSTRLPDVVKAAFEGRVAHLFAAEGAQTMGVFDRTTMQMAASGRHEDLVSAAALQTIAHGGDVFILSPADMPGGQEITMAAVLRY